MDKIFIGILSTSDRIYKNIYEDSSSKELIKILDLYIKNPKKYIYKLIPDDMLLIQETLKNLSKECPLIYTIGGSGPSRRDVTVEATKNIAHKILPGFGEVMRGHNFSSVPTTILSIQTAAILNNSLIVNLPGKLRAIKECLDIVFPATPYCIDLINGPYIEANEKEIKVFRPTTNKIPIPTPPPLTHINEQNNPSMVYVGDKNITKREAIASGRIFVSKSALAALDNNKKGPVIQTAIIAAIMGAKQTHHLIPMCHPLNLSNIECHINKDERNSSLEVISKVQLSGQTGVEMEALTATSIALLTIYDMLKAVDKSMYISDIKLIHKSGGKSDIK